MLFRLIVVTLVSCSTTVMAAGHPGVSISGGPGLSLSTTNAPTAEVASQARSRYRACLFAYLPRVGSDAAAEFLRNACAEEYLGARRSPAALEDGRKRRTSATP